MGYSWGMRPGALIGDFEVERLAGSGGMGEVFRARDRRTGTPVALKVLRGQRFQHQHAERFAREARLLSELHHPGIVRYVGHGSTPSGDPYLAMEWIDGEMLSERLLRAPLTLVESLTLGLRVAEALQSPHRTGVVHRDLKPSNLALPGGAVEHVKILDFGIARLLDPGRTQVTATGVMLGTPGYMAPEQARGAPDVDTRADVFALGSILFRCVTGSPAFPGEDLLAVLIKSTMEDAPRVSERRPDIPPEVEDLIGRMLARPREERPAGAGVLAVELRDVLRKVGGGAAMVQGGEPAPRQARRRPARVTSAAPRPTCMLVARPAESVTRAQEESSTASFQRMEPMLAEAARPYGATVTSLADGSMVVTLDDDLAAGGGATGAEAQEERALRAARCALALKPLLADAKVVLVTQVAAEAQSADAGTVDAGSADTPSGELADRAVRLLSSGQEGAILLDEGVASSLPPRFEFAPTRTGRTLIGESQGLLHASPEPLAATVPFKASVVERASANAMATPPVHFVAPPQAPVSATAGRRAYFTPAPSSPTPGALSVSGSTSIAPVPRKLRSWPLFVIAGAGVLLLALAGGFLIAFTVASPDSIAACAGERCEPVGEHAAKSADAIGMLPRIKRIAAAAEPSAALVHIMQVGRADGTADVTGGASGMILYTFRYRAAGAPSGGTLVLTVQGGRITLTRGGPAASEPLPDPLCPLAQVITRSLGSVPQPATIALNYMRLAGAPAWTAGIGGRNGAILDGQTCAVRAVSEPAPSAAPGGTQTSSPASSPPAGPSPQKGRRAEEVFGI